MPATIDLASDKARFDDRCDISALMSAIRKMDLMAISGLRVIPRPTGVTLPVSGGWQVWIDLQPNDEYTVRRVLKRGFDFHLKGELTGIYAENLSDVAYQASAFESNKFGDHDPLA